MKKIWKTVLLIVLVMAVLGGILIGVAFLTGADFERVKALFNAQFELSAIKVQYAAIAEKIIGIGK